MADVLIENKTKANAIKLLAAAEKVGQGRTAVKSVYNGFLVTEEVAQEFNSAEKPKATRSKKAPAKKVEADDTKEGTD